MAEARGEKIVMSAPRSRSSRSWFCSIDSRISSSEMAGYAGEGRPAPNASSWLARQSVCGPGAVV